jgi:spore photoproduct lyase
LGEHRSAVRRSEELGNCCPNYHHFSPYGFCPYNCAYCYLAGTPGVRFSPTVKIFVNLPEILDEVDRQATALGKPTAFYLGKLQDALALDPLTGYSRTIIPFFADHRFARLTLLTKSAEVDSLLDLDHRGRSILSWSVNPVEIVQGFETNTPSLEGRLAAMEACRRAGYSVRAVVMPIVPVAGWEGLYDRFLRDLLTRVGLSRITLGSICSYPAALSLTEKTLGASNPISVALDKAGGKSPDGRLRFPAMIRERVYRRLLATIRETAPGLEISLCLEDPRMFCSLGLENGRGRCNCVL